jgi:hypothetical protein
MRFIAFNLLHYLLKEVMNKEENTHSFLLNLSFRFYKNGGDINKNVF